MDSPDRFRPAVDFLRTDEERRCQRRSWERTDDAFFAAGACHVLAFRFLDRHPDEDYHAVLLRPVEGFLGSHAYASNGTWAFDFNGWTREEELLAQSAAACRRRWPGWRYDRIRLHGTLEAFCRLHHHRPPSEYHHDPIPRADAFLDRFPPRPPTS